MTLQDLFDQIGQHPAEVLFFFAGVPVVALLVGLIAGREVGQSPWTYIYAGLIYLACVPGVFAVTLCLFTFFFEGSSFLEVNALVYFLPIVSMIVTLVLIRRFVPLEDIPGFRKILGLLMMIFVTFVAILLLQKTRIWVVFVGSVWHLLGLFVILLAVFMYGRRRLMRA